MKLFFFSSSSDHKTLINSFTYVYVAAVFFFLYDISVSLVLETASGTPTDLSHVGDEERQPSTEEESQEDSQSQTGLECPPTLPVSQATLAVH